MEGSLAYGNGNCCQQPRLLQVFWPTSFSRSPPLQGGALRSGHSRARGLPCAGLPGFLAAVGVVLQHKPGDLGILGLSLGGRAFDLCRLKCWRQCTFQMQPSAACRTPPTPGRFISLLPSSVFPEWWVLHLGFTHIVLPPNGLPQPCRRCPLLLTNKEAEAQRVKRPGSLPGWLGRGRSGQHVSL